MGGEHAYKRRLGKDRSPRQSLHSNCDREIRFTALMRRSPYAQRLTALDPKGTSAAILETTCALTVDSWTVPGHRANGSSVPNTKLGERASNERHVIAVPDRAGVDCTLET